MILSDSADITGNPRAEKFIPPSTRPADRQPHRSQFFMPQTPMVTSDTEQQPVQWIALRSCLIPICFLLALFVLIAYPIIRDISPQLSRGQALNDVDHKAVLSAAIHMMDEVPPEGLRFASSPDGPIRDSRVPDVIQNLDPQWISITRERVQIELHGGFDHYGFVACKPGVTPTLGRGAICVMRSETGQNWSV